MTAGGHMTAVYLQVGGDAALVPQQAAVTQFDGGDELSSTIALRLIPETEAVSWFTPDQLIDQLW